MKILCIDDNPDITDFCEAILPSAGHQCKITNSGKEGLKLIKKKESDVVLLDLAMPKFSGRDVIDELLKEGPIEKYNIYLFTASVITEDTVNELLKLGAKGLIRKPLRIDTLLDILQKQK